MTVAPLPNFTRFAHQRWESTHADIDENAPGSGRDGFVVMGGKAQGRIFIHSGHDTVFTAVRAR